MTRITPDKISACTEGGALLVATCLDLLGEPPVPLHPVVWYGKLIERMVKMTPRGKLPQLTASPNAAYSPLCLEH